MYALVAVCHAPDVPPVIDALAETLCARSIDEPVSPGAERDVPWHRRTRTLAELLVNTRPWLRPGRRAALARVGERLRAHGRFWLEGAEVTALGLDLGDEDATATALVALVAERARPELALHDALAQAVAAEELSTPDGPRRIAERLADHDDGAVRALAVPLLAESGPATSWAVAERALLARLRADPDPRVREAALRCVVQDE